MAEIGLRPRLLVKDVMSSPVITVGENASVRKASQLMANNEIGCVIVVTKKAKPTGIITTTDLVKRVLAKNVQPSKLRVKEVMTSPLITIGPEETLTETARRMSHLNIRRLGVVYKGNLVGIISSKGILAVTPELIETIQEKARLERENEIEEVASLESAEEIEEVSPVAGYCEQCGSWAEELNEVEGTFLCEECKIGFESE